MERDEFFDTQQIVDWSWKDGLVKGLIIGVVLGSGMIAFLGLAVCPNV